MSDPHSYLYVPGDRPEMLSGASARGAHALVVDLEDSVAPARKDEARTLVAEWLDDLAAAPPPVEIWIRVNHGPEGVPAADLTLSRLGPVTGVTLPKVESPQQVEDVASSAHDLAVIALIESARGIMAAEAIAMSPAVARLALGEADLAADLGCEPSADILHPLRLAMVVASAASGLPRPVGPVSTDFTDQEEFRRTSLQLKRIGFGARSVIHPAQVGPANEIFGSDPEEVEAARRIVDAADAAEATGTGVFLADDGRMVDAAVVRRARRLLEDAAD